MSRVDIVIPCYNAQRTLGATIESALAQDSIDTIVVVDDGSTDGSLAVARSFAPRVKVMTGPNRGVAHARNRGAAEGQAEWLLFLDSDDLLVRDTVGLRLAAAHAHAADIVICDWDDFDDGDSAAGAPRSLDWPALRIDPEKATATDVWAPPVAVLCRRAVFEQTGGFRADVSPIEDARLLFDLARLKARFAHAAHRGARYRLTPGSLSRADPARFWCSVLRNGQQIEAVWREAGAFDTTRRGVVAGIYNTAARGLFRTGHADYFVAVAAQRHLGRTPLHGRIAAPLARALGFATARSLLSLVGRS